MTNKLFPTSKESAMKPSSRAAGICAAIALASLTASHAAMITSTPAGGVFSVGASWVGGNPPVTDDAFTVVSASTITLDSAFSTQSAGGTAIDGGTLTVANGGSLGFSGSTNSLTSANILTTGTSTINVQSGGSISNLTVSSGGSTTINISGTVGMSRNDPYNGSLGYTANNSSITVNVNTGGVLNYGGRSFGGVAANSQQTTINIAGGTFNYTNTQSSQNWTSSTTLNSVNMSAGVMDLRGRAIGWNTSNGQSLTWTGGTIANVYGNGGFSNQILDDFGDGAGQIIDINNQIVSGTAQSWNIGTTAMSATQGKIQFDIYSTTSSDSIAGGTGLLDLGAGVTIALGYVGGTITDPNDFLGQNYVLFSGFSSYAALDATVTSALWNDGTQTWEVTFLNNLSTDGSVTISGITAVPEVSTWHLFALGLLGLMIVRRRRCA